MVMAGSLILLQSHHFKSPLSAKVGEKNIEFSAMQPAVKYLSVSSPRCELKSPAGAIYIWRLLGIRWGEELPLKMAPLTRYFCCKPQNTEPFRVIFILMRVCISAWSVVSPAVCIWTGWGGKVDSKDMGQLNVSYFSTDQQTTCCFYD